MLNKQIEVQVLSSDSYAQLLIEVSRWYANNGHSIEIINDHFLSDRFSKRAYYFCTYKNSDE